MLSKVSVANEVSFLIRQKFSFKAGSTAEKKMKPALELDWQLMYKIWTGNLFLSLIVYEGNGYALLALLEGWFVKIIEGKFERWSIEREGDGLGEGVLCSWLDGLVVEGGLEDFGLRLGFVAFLSWKVLLCRTLSPRAIQDEAPITKMQSLLMSFLPTMTKKNKE